MSKHVQFEDSSENKIITVFGGEQDDNVHDNLGIVEDDDPRLINFHKRLNFETT